MIQIIIFSSCFGLVFSLYSGIVQHMKQALAIERLKPLDCEACMSFWTCFGVALFTSYNIYDAIGAAFVSFVLTLLIRSHIKPFGQ